MCENGENENEKDDVTQIDNNNMSLFLENAEQEDFLISDITESEIMNNTLQMEKNYKIVHKNTGIL